MLMQWENCRTIFQLDETRLKKRGSKVRCSRCRQIFMAYPPIAPTPPHPEDRADTLMPASVEEGPPPVPGKDEAFEAELEGVFADSLVGPPPDLEREGIPLTQGKEAWHKDSGREETEEVFEEDMAYPEAEPSRKKPSKRGLRIVLLTLLLILVAGVAAAIHFKPDLLKPYLALLKPPEARKPPEQGIRLLQFESVAGSFVDAAKGGQLFVIRGVIKSQYPKPRSHILVKGSILDNQGKVLDSKVSYAGNTFTEEELKILPVEEVLKAMQHRDGMARQNVNVPSGAAIPFMIVFQALPENMSEFAVEAVSSFPGA